MTAAKRGWSNPLRRNDAIGKKEIARPPAHDVEM
jgi:hypothetical protein